MTGQLQRRSDGACETKDGLFAVKLRVVSGIKEDMKWFEFKATILGPVTRIEWPEHAPFALLPQEEAKTLVRAGYAIGITDQQTDGHANVASVGAVIYRGQRYRGPLGIGYSGEVDGYSSRPVAARGAH